MSDDLLGLASHFDLWFLQNLVEETSLSVCVAHFNDIILRDDSSIQQQFFTLELLQQEVADVDGHDVEQFDLDLCLLIVPLHLGAHVTNVFWLLKQSGHCLFASVDCLNILLG